MRPPTPARIAWASIAAFTLAIGIVTVVDGLAATYPLRLLQGIAIAVAAMFVIAFFLSLVTSRFAGWRAPASEEEFEQLVERAEQLARDGSWGESEDDLAELDEDDEIGIDPWNEEDFRAIVRSAVDDLPLEFHRALEHVAIVISDGGRRRRAYGLYHGDTVARDGFADRIVIYRDTLLRDFGHDHDLLQAQVTRTLRHELAHHLGWDEDGVRGLGL